MEEDNGVYVWDGTTWTKINVAQGPRGATGPTGPTGADGIIGQIEGVVETAADLPESGIEQGTIFYVASEDQIYAWDAVNGWFPLGMVQGPRGADGSTGPTGDTGPTGPQGPVGVITGSVDSVGDLPETGSQGDMYLVNGVLYVWDEDTNSWNPMGDLKGPTGPTGPVGTILGSYDTLGELERDHPVGNQGDTYLVDGTLYVWDVDNNSWRAVGNLRPTTESTAIIPFASQVAPLTFVNGGVPARVSLIGFGYGDRRADLLTENYSFAVNSDNSFVLEGGNDNLQLAFSLPFDMIIRSIALTTGNWAEYYPSGNVYPYVQLYAAAPTSNNFMAIEGAAAIPETGHNAGTVPANTMLYALRENLDVRLRAGTRIAIGGLARIDGDTAARDYYLYFTGGIGMTRWIE